MRRGTLAVALLAPVAMAGCFSYVPVDLARVEVADRVRAEVDLSEERAAEEPLARLGPVVRGQVLARTPEALTLRVPLAPGAGGSPGVPGLAETVAIPAPAIRRLEVREMERGRTVALTMGGAALLGFILYQAFERTDPRGQNGENPPPADEAILRLPVRPF